MYLYPDNLRAKAKLWLWELKDIAVIGVGLLLSVLALTQGAGMLLLVLTVLYAFLSIRTEGPAFWTSCAAPSVSCFAPTIL